MGAVNEKMIYILDTVEQDIVLKVISHRNGFQLNILQYSTLTIWTFLPKLGIVWFFALI